MRMNVHVRPIKIERLTDPESWDRANKIKSVDGWVLPVSNKWLCPGWQSLNFCSVMEFLYTSVLRTNHYCQYSNWLLSVALDFSVPYYFGIWPPNFAFSENPKSILQNVMRVLSKSRKFMKRAFLPFSYLFQFKVNSEFVFWMQQACNNGLK